MENLRLAHNEFTKFVLPFPFIIYFIIILHLFLLISLNFSVVNHCFFTKKNHMTVVIARMPIILYAMFLFHMILKEKQLS